MPSELERFNERMQAFFAPLWPGEEKPLVLGEGCSERPPRDAHRRSAGGTGS